MYRIIYLPIAKQDITDIILYISDRLYIRPVKCAKGSNGSAGCIGAFYLPVVVVNQKVTHHAREKVDHLR